MIPTSRIDRLSRHVLGPFAAAAAVIAVGAATGVHAQQEDKPVQRFKLPAGQLEKLQEKEESAQKEGGKEKGGAVTPSKSPAAQKKLPAVQQREAVSPSSLEKKDRPDIRGKLPAAKKNEGGALPEGAEPTGGEMSLDSITPARGSAGSTVRIRGEWLGGSAASYKLVIGDGARFVTMGGFHELDIRRRTQTEIEAVIPDDVPPGEYQIAPYHRFDPRPGQYIMSGGGSLSFEVVTGVAPAARDALPDDAGRPSIPDPGPAGGFTPSPGGLVGQCEGPDPAAVLEVKRVFPRGGSSYDLHLAVRIENRGQTDYRSGPNQQGWRLLTSGNNSIQSRRWGPDLAAGDSQEAVQVVEGWSPGTEFVAGYELAISYDPDITIDGNPENDDCRSGNNRADLSVADIESEIARRGL